MKNKRISGIVIAAIASLSLLAMAGCGGGGGGGAKSSAVTPGKGLVRAYVSVAKTTAFKEYLASRELGRSAGQTSGTIVVSISISGVYSEDNSVFPPVTAQINIDPVTGDGFASVSEVPIGINHLLKAVAKWPDGSTETVMTIIPKVSEGVTADAYADQASTALTAAVIYYAETNNTTLNKVDSATILKLVLAVAQLSEQGVPYSSMSPATLNSIIQVASIVISPASANVEIGATQQFTVAASGANSAAITGLSATWSVSGSVGSIDSAGLFTADSVGTGIISAVIGTATANATVNVACSPLCVLDADCDDSDTLTIDTCSNAGTCSAECVNATCAIECTSDAGCDDSDSLTIDTCFSPGTCEADCLNTACNVACSSDTACDDSDSLTIDTCLNAETCGASCDNTACNVACSSDTACDDANALTIDTCSNAGTCSAVCSNTNCAIACTADIGCDDSNALTLDTCSAASTCNAACVNTAIACNIDSDCDDSDTTTFDTCTGGGTALAVCVNTPISVDGTVTLSGSPVVDALVAIYNDTYNASILTDINGYYYFLGVPSGDYEIIATKDNTTLESAAITVP